MTGYVVAAFIELLILRPLRKQSGLRFLIFIYHSKIIHHIHLGLILIMIPIVFITVSEHIGHQMVINKIVGKTFKDPSLDKSIIGDGIDNVC